MSGRSQDEKFIAKAGDDTVGGNGGSDCVIDGEGDDTLRTRTGNALIIGGDGDDLIGPNRGEDHVNAGDGDEDIDTSDGNPDLVNCGGGVDTVVVDQFDTLHDCENVTIETRSSQGIPKRRLLWGGVLHWEQTPQTPTRRLRGSTRCTVR